MIPQQGTLEISRSRFRHNLALLRNRIGGATICATVKADAYGHGAALMSALLLQAGVRWACVYSLDEALPLAALGWEGLLVLAPLVLTDDNDPPHPALRAGVRVNITDMASARHLSAIARRSLAAPVRVHVQVDAGLTRAGAHPREATDLAALVAELPGLALEGLFAHLSHGDVAGHEAVREQLAALRAVAEPLRQDHPKLMVHLQNSGGAWHLGDSGLDLVRIGIALYGLQPSMSERIDGLQPIARLTAPILAIHDRPAGTGVGYGHTFITQRPSRLAIVPVGYAEGYPRLISNRIVAQVAGATVPVVGRVSMDQIVLDVTDLPGVKPGDTVTVVSWNPADANSLDAMAQSIGTIGYELATHLGSRLIRVIVD